MKPAALRKLCLGLPGAREEFPFGEDINVYKVAGKVFALGPLKAKPLRISLKCEPDLAVRLRAEHPAITPGYHLNKRHWNTVELDGSLTDDFVREMIEDSYDLVVAGLPKREQEKLNWVALSQE
ncbi:DNA-binding protein [Amycolatopsis sp. WAC 01375]|uniref:MmcQ/YjbR family DNA-binding protein n=1 Tax=unclassified Amycolatopsis TaxID=2618356 RepID=UPI000F7938D0|nr:MULTISPECIES: MmcQ/YjbR family DNA-binding protein [unclassified Amycolatopsis]RSM76917.1 DNA-binding protein [Amycolatopsis sp. WAC 01375]RSN26018.1 DNA-binding protein [Amycolatopsis sp. WAC 01416]